MYEALEALERLCLEAWRSWKVKRDSSKLKLNLTIAKIKVGFNCTVALHVQAGLKRDLSEKNSTLKGRARVERRLRPACRRACASEPQ